MIRPLVAVAAVSVIIASGVGVAAITGYLPSSIAKQEPSSASAGSTAPQVQGTPQAQVAPRAAAPAKATCRNCGVVKEVKEVVVKGETTGVGAVAGGVVGAVVGNQFGHGDGRKVMTVAGAAGGALAGNEIEKHSKTSKRYDISVRMDDGTIRTVSSDTQPSWRIGDRVRVSNGLIAAL